MDRNPPPTRPGPDRSTADLVKDLVSGTQTLVREEIELAKLELAENVKAKAIGGAMFGAVAVLALFLVTFLGLAGGAALKLVVPEWAAWLIVAGVFLLLIVVLALVGRNKLSGPTGPEQSIERAKEDVSWAKQQFNRS